MSRDSPFLAAGRRLGSSTSGTSYRNDDDRYVDDNLVKKLQRKRNSVIRLMNDAEEKQFKDQSVKEWVVDIKHALYDANALLDKIDTEARFREKYKEDGSPSYSISGFVQWATSEISRIIEELQDTVKDAAANMGLKARDEGAAASAEPTHVRNDRVTSPVLSKSTIVYGREKEKTRILKRVLYSPESAAPGNKPEVIAIVGMGGVGKTTLAKYVYNHADVERCFTRSWACVSDNFDLVGVTRAILEYLTESPVGVCDLASLQRQLEKQLTGKRFLVVLDDTWDFSKQNWEKLMAPFSTGATGSKIILTTRDIRVAGAAPADHSFQLKSMSQDEAWSLFSCEVFGDGELSQHPKLEAIGKEIVMKCQGLPLAIKTLSGLLRSERKEVEWERVRESSLWQLPEGQKDIIPALGLSYSYLPSYLKTCFAYCSLFPKDYEFSKVELVNLWVDEGFLQQPNDNRSIEDVGVASFDDLSSRLFFTHYGERYVMHDFIHDLAQMVFADFHLQLNGHKAVKECKKVRHISFHDTRERGGSSMKFEVLNQAESLQTFMVVPCEFWQAPRWGLDDRILEDAFRQQLPLRVLCLRGTRIRTLPDTISNLKQLRCLDVSYTDVEELPASLCKLYNLRRLLCKNCHQLKEFHFDMAAFVSLRHFTLCGWRLSKAPWNLSGVQIDESSFSYRGTGEVAGLQSDLLESLRPHRDVKEVCIVHGTEFPGWLVDRSYLNIEEVVLKNCWISSGLMQGLGGLPSLKHLDLRDVRNVKKLGSELYNSTAPFGSLEKLSFIRMKEWEEWEPSDGAYPRLQRLRISDCPKLKGRLPSNLPSLETLSIMHMKELEEWGPSDGAYPRLQKLSIVGCPKLKGRLPSNLPSLETLSIMHMKELEELLFKLMEELEEWGPSDGAYPRLQDLHIEGCPKLKVRLPSNLPSLVVLVIINCSELKALPVKLPCSLKMLYLFNNHPDLKERCKRDTGPDWPNIAHVPHIHIS